MPTPCPILAIGDVTSRIRRPARSAPKMLQSPMTVRKAPKPIVAPGTPFTPDLQSWIRNEHLQPDWLRIGTDIVGGSPAPTFNASFSLHGNVSHR